MQSAKCSCSRFRDCGRNGKLKNNIQTTGKAFQLRLQRVVKGGGLDHVSRKIKWPFPVSQEIKWPFHDELHPRYSFVCCPHRPSTQGNFFKSLTCEQHCANLNCKTSLNILLRCRGTSSANFTTITTTCIYTQRSH